MEKYRKVDLFTLELGSDLCLQKCLDEILKAVSLIREEIFAKYGVVIPKICVKENDSLKPREYVIKINEYSAGRFEFKKNALLILDTGFVSAEMDGNLIKEPVFGVSGLWIPKGKRDAAEQNGYEVLTTSRLIKVHLTEKIKENLSSVVTTQYVGELFNEMIKENRFLCTQIVKKYGTSALTVVKLVLCSLLEEGVSIRNLLPILETISTEPTFERAKIPALVNKVRCVVIPDIIASLDENNNEIKVLLLSQRLLEFMFDSITKNGEIIFAPAARNRFTDELSLRLREMSEQGLSSIVLCVEPLRYRVKLLLDSLGFSNVHVLSDVEMNVALKKFNTSLYIFKEIGVDFVPSVGMDTCD